MPIELHTYYMQDEKGDKKCAQHEINKLVSSLYQKIYNLDPTEINFTQIYKREEPEFWELKIEQALENFESNKVGENDNIKNEHLKYRQGTSLIKWQRSFLTKYFKPKQFQKNGSH